MFSILSYVVVPVKEPMATGEEKHGDGDRDGMRGAPGCSHFIPATRLPGSHTSSHLLLTSVSVQS